MYVTLDILIFEGEVGEWLSLLCRQFELRLDECQNQAPRGALYTSTAPIERQNPTQILQMATTTMRSLLDLHLRVCKKLTNYLTASQQDIGSRDRDTYGFVSGCPSHLCLPRHPVDVRMRPWFQSPWQWSPARPRWWARRLYGWKTGGSP